MNMRNDTEHNFTIALAGNPNVGKSTIFNALTHLRQHTGNWSGKTVACAFGEFIYQDIDCHVVDLPGIYSLRTHSEEEEIAREYICSGEADLLLVVCDATCLERGLHLLKQIAGLKETNLPPTILCVNLCDEAAKKGIVLDFALIEKHLNIPVIPCTARSKNGLNSLKEKIYEIYNEQWDDNQTETDDDLTNNNEHNGKFCCGCPFHQDLCRQNLLHSQTTDSAGDRPRISRYIPPAGFSPKWLAAQAVTYTNPTYRNRQEKFDRLVTGKFTGTLIMIILLLGIFWLTITGANYPSSFLWDQFYKMETFLAAWLTSIGAAAWFTDVAVYGVFRVVAWIVSVMLPPMAIFFPLFTLLEDFGYLPRVAFNMDCAFKRCKACGKQCLTMCIVNTPGLSQSKNRGLINNLPFSEQIFLKM